LALLLSELALALAVGSAPIFHRSLTALLPLALLLLPALAMPTWSLTHLPWPLLLPALGLSQLALPY
jgi:hypothetical protein